MTAATASSTRRATRTPARVSTSQHVAYLRPRALPRQRVRRHELAVEPAPGAVDAPRRLLRQRRRPVHDADAVRRAARARAEPRRGAARGRRRRDPDASPPWEDVRDALVYRRGAPAGEAAQFAYRVALRRARSASWPTFARGVVRARPAAPRGGHRPDAPDPRGVPLRSRRPRPSRRRSTRVLAERRGVCQDFAHLQIACLRSLGLAARYVSGYLLTDPPPGQPRLRRRRRLARLARRSAARATAGSISIRPTTCLPDRAARDARLGPRLRRRQPAARRDPRRRAAHARRRRQRGPPRRRPSGTTALRAPAAS